MMCMYYLMYHHVTWQYFFPTNMICVCVCGVSYVYCSLHYVQSVGMNFSILQPSLFSGWPTQKCPIRLTPKHFDRLIPETEQIIVMSEVTLKNSHPVSAHVCHDF